MKKIIIIIVLMLFTSNFIAQTNTFVVNNYSSMILEGRLYANANSGSCYPSIISSSSSQNIIIPPGTNSNPSIVSYTKYADANDIITNFPLTQWWVQTASTSPAGYRPVASASLNANGPIAMGTNWTGFYMVTRYPNGNYAEEHPVGNPAYFNCTSCYTSYNFAGITEAEWFTIGTYTYVQVF